MIEVVQQTTFPLYGLILFATGLTAITYIAIIMFLDLQPEKEPIQLPQKP